MGAAIKSTRHGYAVRPVNRQFGQAVDPSTESGLIVEMETGESWFHPYNGKAPFRLITE